MKRKKPMLYITPDDPDDLERSRLLALVRGLLIIPHSVYGALWGGALFMLACTTVPWTVALILGRLPDVFHRWYTSFLIYQTRVNAYALMLADGYPPFNSEDGYEIDVHAPLDPVRQNRLTILLRALLAIPSMFRAFFQAIGLAWVGWFAYLAVLLLGRHPERCYRWEMKVMQYQLQLTGYLFLVSGARPKATQVISDGFDFDDDDDDAVTPVQAPEEIDLAARIAPYVPDPRT